MLTWFAKRFLAKFERQWDYDTTYARDMLDAGGYEAIAPMFGFRRQRSTGATSRSMYWRPRDSSASARVTAVHACSSV